MTCNNAGLGCVRSSAKLSRSGDLAPLGRSATVPSAVAGRLLHYDAADKRTAADERASGNKRAANDKRAAGDKRAADERTSGDYLVRS